MKINHYFHDLFLHIANKFAQKFYIKIVIIVENIYFPIYNKKKLNFKISQSKIENIIFKRSIKKRKYC